MNSRLDEIHAAMLLVRLKWLPSFTERRRMISNAYRTGILNPSVQHMAAPEEQSAHAYHLYVITCERREELHAHLLQHQVQTHFHYPIPVHKQDSCKHVKTDPAGLQVSEHHADTCLSLPCHPQMSDADIEKVIEFVNLFQ